MSRLMESVTNKEHQIVVIEHIILKNFWEIYVTEVIDDGLIFGMTVGIETELGYIDTAEIESFIISRTKDLEEVLPAPEWRWSREMPLDDNDCPIHKDSFCLYQ